MWIIEIKTQRNHPALLNQVLDGQKRAWDRFVRNNQMIGVLDQKIHQEGFLVCAFHASTGELVGGLRGYYRARAKRKLPIEMPGTYLPEEHLPKLACWESLAELRGLWIDEAFASQGLSMALANAGIQHCYAVGSEAIVGVAYSVFYEKLYKRIGFEMDETIEAFPMPGDAQLAVVGWHKAASEFKLVQVV